MGSRQPFLIMAYQMSCAVCVHKSEALVTEFANIHPVMSPCILPSHDAQLVTSIGAFKRTVFLISYARYLCL